MGTICKCKPCMYDVKKICVRSNNSNSSLVDSRESRERIVEMCVVVKGV